jgi:hypothetical protein
MSRGSTGRGFQHALVDRLTGDVDANNARGPLQALPIADRERRELGIRDNALRDPAAGTEKTPFEAAVAGVEDEDHR